MNTGTRVQGRQRGTVLVISLVMLLTMTLIGVTALRTTILEEKMAGNLRDQNIALNASESGHREGLDWIDQRSKTAAGMPLPTKGGSTQVWVECSVGMPEDLVGNADCAKVGRSVAAAKWLDANGAELGTYLKLSADAKKFLGDTVAELPMSVTEERYSPPVEFEDAALKRGVVHYTVTSLGYGGTMQARAVLQTTVSVPKL